MFSTKEPLTTLTTKEIDAKLATSESPLKLAMQESSHACGTVVELPGNLLVSMRSYGGTWLEDKSGIIADVTNKQTKQVVCQILKIENEQGDNVFFAGHSLLSDGQLAIAYGNYSQSGFRRKRHILIWNPQTLSSTVTEQKIVTYQPNYGCSTNSAVSLPNGIFTLANASITRVNDNDLSHIAYWNVLGNPLSVEFVENCGYQQRVTPLTDSKLACVSRRNGDKTKLDCHILDFKQTPPTKTSFFLQNVGTDGGVRIRNFTRISHHTCALNLHPYSRLYYPTQTEEKEKQLARTEGWLQPNQIGIFDLDKQTRIATLESRDEILSTIAVPGDYLVSLNQRGDVELWDVEAKQPLVATLQLKPTQQTINGRLHRLLNCDIAITLHELFNYRDTTYTIAGKTLIIPLSEIKPKKLSMAMQAIGADKDNKGDRINQCLAEYLGFREPRLSLFSDKKPTGKTLGNTTSAASTPTTPTCKT